MLSLYAKKYDNYLLNKEDIEKRRIIFKSKPVSLFFRLTDACQLNCIMCNNHKNSQNKFINFEIISKLLDYYGEDAMHVSWIGGEALLHPDFDKLIDYSKKYELKQVLTTNGLLLKGIVAEKLIKYDSDIVISIDGSNKQIYESIRQKSNFDLLMKNIDELNILRKKYNHKGHFGINFCVFKNNYKDVIDILELAKEKQFKGITFLIMYSDNKDLLLDRHEENILKDLLIKAKQKAKEYNISFAEQFIKKDKQDSKAIICYAPLSTLGLSADLKYGICNCKDIVCNEVAIDKLWNCENVQLYRKNVYNNIKPNSICEMCNIYEVRNNYHPQIFSIVNDIERKLKMEGV